MNKIVSVVAIIIVLVIGLFFLSKKLLAPSPSGPSVANQERNPKDINWDNQIDQTDADIIKSVIGCKKTDPCWNQVIGKTVTGDNPIYASDCDLNHDEVIDQKDINIITSSQ